jgi:predicted alpha/beta superfamily hydrolase
MKKNINGFKLYEKKPNAIKYGFLFIKKMTIPVPFEQKRTVRVYLPEDYDPKKKYPVMYMSDGQNIVDKYTTLYGEWNIDVRMHERISKGLSSFIVVGIDCPKHPIRRMQEYISNSASLNEKMIDDTSVILRKLNPVPYGHIYNEWIVNTLKPIIDSSFSTLVDKENTASGGSSMGGLFAFEIASLYPKTFGFALSFSPAFDLFKERELIKEFKSRNLSANKQKYFFFCGGKDLDATLLPGTISIYNLMTKLGFDNDHNGLIVDSRCGHSEKTWSKYYNDAIKFWLKK